MDQEIRCLVRASYCRRYVRIEIEDNGAGISANILDRIFEPCFTTKPGGSGLGLAAVKSIMFTQHAGDITIESQERPWDHRFIDATGFRTPTRPARCNSAPSGSESHWTDPGY